MCLKQKTGTVYWAGVWVLAPVVHGAKPCLAVINFKPDKYFIKCGSHAWGDAEHFAQLIKIAVKNRFMCSWGEIHALACT